MSWNAGILNPGPKTFFREHVAVADATGLYSNSHLACARVGNLALDNLKIRSGFRDLSHFHCRQFRFRCYFQRCHKSSCGIAVIVEKPLQQAARHGAVLAVLFSWWEPLLVIHDAVEGLRPASLKFTQPAHAEA